MTCCQNETLAHCHFSFLLKFIHMIVDQCFLWHHVWVTPTQCQSHWKSHTVLAVSKCVKHGETWNTVLKHVGVKIWCGTCRCDTGRQCWVHWVNVKAAQFGARMLKRRPPGGGGACQKRLKSGFLRGKKWMKWPEIFMGQSQPPGQSFPHGCIPRVLWHHAQACKNPVSGLRGCYVLWSS